MHRDLPIAVGEPVPSHEQDAVLRGQGFQEVLNQPDKLLLLYVSLHCAGRGQTALQLLQRHRVAAAAPLGRSVRVIPHEGKIADDSAQEGQQRIGPRRRDGVPSTQVGVVHTFLRVLAAVQDVVGQTVADLTVFAVQLSERLL